MSKYLEAMLAKGQTYDQITPLNIFSYEELVRKLQTEPVKPPISTGNKELDEVMGGFENGRLYVLSAMTKQGKTTMAQTIMYQMSLNNLPSLFFSFEMGWKEVIEKYIAMDKCTGLGNTTLPLFMPIELHRGGGELQYQWLFEAIAKAIVEKGIKLVVIDHLHFLLPLKDYQNTSFIIGGIVREVKRMAVVLNIPIILIAHTTKIKDDKVPDWTDIRDSSFITQEADVVLMMYRIKNKEAPKKTTDDSPAETYTQKTALSVELDRVRGRSGKILMWHNGTMFERYQDQDIMAKIKPYAPTPR